MCERPGPGAVVWLTGLSGAGKTTLARRLEAALLGLGRAVEVLDGDELRRTLCAGLGFSREDRDANVARIGFVAGLLARHGVLAVVSAISPYREARRSALALAPRRLEVFVDAPLEVCQARDPKGLYARARRGELAHLTGFEDPYEAPLEPDLHLRTDRLDPDACLALLLEAIRARGALA